MGLVKEAHLTVGVPRLEMHRKQREEAAGWRGQPEVGQLAVTEHVLARFRAGLAQAAVWRPGLLM